MTELLEATTSSANIIPTALLVFVLLYWLIVIVGLLDFDSFDFDVDTDLDANGMASVEWLNSALAFFNLGRVPFMIWVSFLVLPFWAFAILLNYYLHTATNIIGFLLLLPAFIGALFLSKILTAPFVRLFAALEKEHDSNVTIIGQVCTVTLPATASEMGQASVKTTGAPLLLNVKTAGVANLKKGETALVIDYSEQHKYYLIEPYETV